MIRKRSLLCVFLSLLIGLLGCSAASSGDSGGVLLYYRSQEAEFGAPDGVLGAERWAFSEDLPTYSEFLNQYFSHLPAAGLQSPFPADLQCLGTSLDDGVLTVLLSEAYAGLQRIERSIAAACITKTLTQFESVSGVCLETGEGTDMGTEAKVLRDKDFVLQDLGAVNTETAVRLYFSDANGRYLVGTERTSYFSDAAQIPGFVVQQLIEGPREEGQLAVMPEGTALRDLQVDEDGACTVNLSSEFLLNKPTTELLERMAILSLVNSLTELETIKSVRILVEGEPVHNYVCMDLDRAFVRDESAMDVVRAGLNEVDATLYVSGSEGRHLAAVPVCIRKTSQNSLPEALMQELISFQDLNGLENPLPAGTAVQYVEQKNGICHVDFSRAFLSCAGNREAENMAVRAVTATLASLDGISYVKFSVAGSHEGFSYASLNRLYTPDDSWFD